MRYRYREPHEMKDSGVEWIEMIPQEWGVKKSKYILDIFGSNVNEKDLTEEETGVNYYKVDDLNVSTKNLNSSKIFSKIKGIKAPLILIPKRGAAIFTNKVKYTNKDCLFDSNLMGLRVKDNCNIYFYMYFLNLRGLDDIADVSSVPQINNKHINPLVTPYPNLKEQQLIADFLDKKIAQFDSIVEKKHSFIAKLEESKKSLISEVVTGKKRVLRDEGGDLRAENRSADEMKYSGVEWLGMIPREWEVKRLKNIVELNPKKLEARNLLDIECTFIPMEKLRTGIIDLEYTKKIEEVYAGYTYFRENDIIMAKVTPCFENRNIAIAKKLKNEIGFGSSELYVFRKKEGTDINYIYYFLQEERFVNIATSEMTGAGGLKRVPSEFLIDFKLMFPKLKEQQLIVEFLDQKIAEIDNTTEKIKFQIEKLKEAKQSLISEAVTGKIEVLD